MKKKAPTTHTNVCNDNNNNNTDTQLTTQTQYLLQKGSNIFFFCCNIVDCWTFWFLIFWATLLLSLKYSLHIQALGAAKSAIEHCFCGYCGNNNDTNNNTNQEMRIYMRVYTKPVCVCLLLLPAVVSHRYACWSINCCCGCCCCLSACLPTVNWGKLR